MAKAHIIGVSGVAMSATAKLLMDAGWSITGSDAACYPPASTYVEKLGFPFFTSYSPNNIPKDVDLVIIGRNAQLTPETNEEVQRAYEMDVPIQSFPEILAEILADKHRVIIAGSYGKSTVTGILSFILLHAKKDPSYFIGAYPIDMEYTSKKGDGEMAVIEGDEYPTAHWDESSKFLHLNADDVILTSVEHDHVNVFPTYAEYVAPFKKLLDDLPQEGLVVACTDNKGVSDMLAVAPQYITYGLNTDALWRAENISYGAITTFTLSHDGKPVVTLHTKLLGAHNVQNIVGAAAYALTRELVTPKELQSAVSAFSGIKRRLNKITETSSVSAYEGFGSSYEKARAAIDAIRLHYPEKNMVVLFEPHTFSWRNRDALSWYDTVFQDVSDVLVFHPAQQGAATHKQLSQEEIVVQVRASGISTHAVTNTSEIQKQLNKSLVHDSVLLILTSGNLDGALDTLPQWLDNHF